MVELDWKTILSFNYQDIKDEDKEKVYESISWMDPGDIEISFGDMKALFIVSQDMMRYKAEQVQSLTSELDEMAIKQGEIEAEMRLNKSRKVSTHAKDLTEQLLQQENEIETNKSILEKLSEEISVLEDQRTTLMKDRDNESDSTPDPISELDRMKEMGDSLKKKNQHIKELLFDLQAIAEENKLLRDKLNHLKSKLSEATHHINDITLLVTNTRGENKHLNEKVKNLSDANAALQNHLQNLTETNNGQDAQLDEFAEQMDLRINEWKDILKEKQDEIEELKKKFKEHQEQPKPESVGQIEPNFYAQMIKQREDQIHHLQSKLAEAAEEMLYSAETIERLKTEKATCENLIDNLRMGISHDSIEGSTTIEKLKIELQRCKIENDDLEECLKIKEIELAEGLKQLNMFESGEFGLKEAMHANKKTKQQLQIRNDHINKLVTDINTHVHLLDQIQLENSVMRKKLNLPSEQPISVDSVLSQHTKRKKELNASLKKLSALEEQKISLQIQLRQKEKCIKKLYSYVKSKGIKLPEHFLAAILAEENIGRQAFEQVVTVTNNGSGDVLNESNVIESSPSEEIPVDDRETTLIRENYQHLIDENEGLRKGLHEILDAIKEKATASPCDITSTCLEKLLRALDARHVAGWYHPAMRMLMELQAERGTQDGLRSMLKEARTEILSTLDLLAKKSQKSLQLEQKLTEIEQSKEVSGELDRNVNSEDIEIEHTVAWAVIQDDTADADFKDGQTIKDTYIKQADKNYSLMLHENLLHFHKQFEYLYDSMIEIFTQNNDDKNKWSAMEEQYKNNIETLSAEIESVKIQLNGINPDQSELEGNNMLKLSDVGDKFCLERKNKYLLQTFKHVRDTNEALKSELFQQKIDTFKKLKSYEVERQKSTFHIANLRNSLRKSIPLDVFLKQNETMNLYEMKYRLSLNKEVFNSNEHVIRDDDNNMTTSMIVKCECLRTENEELKSMLKTEKELRIISENMDSAGDGLRQLASKIASSEAEIAVLNSKLNYTVEVNTLLTQQQENSHSKLVNCNSLLGAANAKINLLESENLKLQEREMALIDKFQSSFSADEVKEDSSVYENAVMENEHLKVAIVQLQSKMESLEEQISDIQHDKLVNGLEINILRHQVLDLQSVNDNKAIIARLSGEILVSHLHTAEMHKKRDKLTKSLGKEKDTRKKLQIVIEEKENQFDNYVSRTNLKISFLSSALQAMREQYQGSIPLAVLDNIYNSREEIKNQLAEIHDLQEEIEKKSKSENIGLSAADLKSMQCLNDDILQCPHYIELKLKESKWEREKSGFEHKIKALEENCFKIETQMNSLEENLLMLSFAFDKTTSGRNENLPLNMKRSTSVVELIDIDVEDSHHAEDQQTLKPTPKPRTMKKPIHKNNEKINDVIDTDVNLPGSPMKNTNAEILPKPSTKTTVVIQTDPESPLVMEDFQCQTDYIEDVKDVQELHELRDKVNILQVEIKEALSMASERSEKNLNLENEKLTLESKMAAVNQLAADKEKYTVELNAKINELNKVIVDSKVADEKADNENEMEHLKNLLKSLKEIESEKDAMIEQYKELLTNEKSEHHDTNVLAQKQIINMKLKIETLEREHNSLKDLLTAPSHVENYNFSMEKYRGKILELEDRCFQLQKDLDTNRATLLSCKSECERWKSLASERFSNMETLSRRLDEKHSNEVVSYKTETSHWLAELGDCRQEVGQLKAEITEQRTTAIRQITERDSAIHKLHTANSSLKHQILNLQTVISASDPTFDLSAIIELEEDADSNAENNSLMQTERSGYNNSEMTSLELNRNPFGDHTALMSFRDAAQPTWSETVVDRIRGEKQLLGKQNALLRKQIRVLTGRERRTRLELNNLRSQMSRTPSHGTNAKSHQVDDAVLLNRKIESLELQLSERSSAHSIDNNGKTKQMALWDKQKRWQEASERWKMRYQEKCAQFERLEKHLDAARVTVSRLEREKRQLDSRLSKSSREGQTPSTVTGNYDNHVEMLLQDKERLEDEVRCLKTKLDGNIKQSSLLEKLEWQQRRITALELAEKGKDVLVNEYERLLGQNSLLTKQNLKLESEILESQLLLVGKRLDPDGSDGENSCCRRVKQQRDHLESYSKLLKEENSYLIAKNIEYTALDSPVPSTGTVSHVKRISDLERTVLTLRGLIGRLQGENKRLHVGTGRSRKCPVQFSDDQILENFKIENERLVRTMKDKDELLERAKSLLRKAADKEKQLVKEISMLKGKTQPTED